MPTKPNDLAYPLIEDNAMSGPSISTGLTKREAIAIAAMQGILSNSTVDVDKHEEISEWAVRQADALIKALNE